MSRKNLKLPRTKNRGEQPIIRGQESFGAGAFFDTPDSEVPSLGVKSAVNYHLYDSFAVTRGGSKYFEGQAALPLRETGLSWSKDADLITATSNVFSETDIGAYCVHDDGIGDQITEYISATVVRVYDSLPRSNSTNGSIRDAIRAQGQNPNTKKCLVQVGEDLYYSDETLSSWTEVIIQSTEKPNNSNGKIVYLGQDWILINSAGIYRINPQGIGWKTNSNIPQERLEEEGEREDENYGYNTIYCMSRLDGGGFGVDRSDEGVKIAQQTGSVRVRKEGEEYKDFSVNWGDNEITEDTPRVIRGFTIPDGKNIEETERHYTHYSYYRSLDVGFNGTDIIEGKGYDPEQLIWVDDIPVARGFFAYKNGGSVIAVIGSFSVHDVGSVIEFIDGSRYEITAWISTNEVEIDAGAYYDLDTELMAAGIGNGTILECEQSGSTVTINDGRAFTDEDIGKFLFFSDGSYDIIKSVISGTSLEMSTNSTRIAQGAVVDPTYRNYNDTKSDEILEDWVSFELPYRRMLPIPECNEGTIFPGFFSSTVRGSSRYWYSSLPAAADYSIGMYYPGLQEATDLQDEIVALSSFPDRMVVYCRSKTYIVASSINSTITPFPGTVLSVLNSPAIRDNTVGCLDFGSLQEIENGADIMLTNENGVPGCRIFNGDQYSDDLTIDASGAYKLVKDSLGKQFVKFASAYIDGEYIVWGIG